ncbi:MAG: efflux RND transporter permease subunit [Verrucomicrobia bacterium]|nr:efflux RND transporter permease subunit [Cytophagales bacterium]
MEQPNSSLNGQEKLHKRFKLTEWCIENKTTVYVATFFIMLAGFATYNNLSKENFPDIIIPQFYIQTINAGTSPGDVETLITKPIEKELKSINGVKKVTSSSIENFSAVVVEFTTGVTVPIAKQRVKDAVDRARPNLPQTLTQEPQVQEVEFSEFPIMQVNVSGNYQLEKLKEYAENLEDAIEELPEIRRVDIVGALEREFQINVDVYQMQAAGLTFNDIFQAVAAENVNISGGELNVNGVRRTLRVTGEFKNVEQIRNVIVRSARGNSKFLREIADVQDDFEEKQDFARLDGKSVISLSVIKRGGENLISASEKIEEIIAEYKRTKFPEGLNITITGDQSDTTQNTLNDLISTVILGFIFVVLVLMFFMGTTDAVFVGLSVPLSSFLAFVIIAVLAFFLPDLKFTLNTVVMFAFLLALGIVVDDAIVVIENTHRIFHDENLPIKDAAKKAAGEVFLPVLSGTLVNVAPFIPLLIWPGIIGEFMKYLPITLIATLLASLFVAFVINPVFAVDFMKRGDTKPTVFRAVVVPMLVLGGIAFMGYFINVGVGNFFIFLALLVALNHYVLSPVTQGFQNKFLPRLKNSYRRLIAFALKGYATGLFIAAAVLLLFLSFVVAGIFQPKVIFFPSGEPDFVYIYNKLPVGTDAKVTDSVTRILEKRVAEVIAPHKDKVKSVIVNVGREAGNPQGNPSERQPASYRSKITVAFIELNSRIGFPTSKVLEDIRKRLQGIPGTEISVERENNGPATGKPVSIEIIGEDLAILTNLEKQLQAGIKKANIQGIEDLKSDMVLNKPEIIIDIDKEKAGREGISSQTVALYVRTALFGSEATKFRDNKDEYPVQIRVKENQRKQIEEILSGNLGYMDMATGGFRQVPLSSVATIRYGNTFSSINRKNQERIITLGSNVLTGYNANEIVAEINQVIPTIKVPEGYTMKTAGEQEDQKETMDFLAGAFGSAMALMFIIMVVQFNSVSKPLIIFTTIVFSLIGILLGFSLSGMTISIVMTGVGFIALAGIVVKNGIILMEFIEELRQRGEDLKTAIIDGGATRLTPVLLTASAAILGLIPLAIGMNFDFGGLFTRFNPNFFIGGESSIFWGPLAWTIIFGLLVTTFLTLIIVPCMYYVVERLKERFKIGRRTKTEVTEPLAVPAE